MNCEISSRSCSALARFEVLTAALLTIQVFWDVTCAVEQVVPSVMVKQSNSNFLACLTMKIKALGSFITMGTNHPVTQYQMPHN
jgi:hypothetical protein